MRIPVVADAEIGRFGHLKDVQDKFGYVSAEDLVETRLEERNEETVVGANGDGVENDWMLGVVSRVFGDGSLIFEVRVEESLAIFDV